MLAGFNTLLPPLYILLYIRRREKAELINYLVLVLDLLEVVVLITIELVVLVKIFIVVLRVFSTSIELDAITGVLLGFAALSLITCTIGRNDVVLSIVESDSFSASLETSVS